MKKILLTLFSLGAFLLASSADLSVCGYGDDGEGGVFFNVCYATDFDIAGFQFNFSEVSGDGDITLTSAAGGDATSNGLSPNFGGATVLGFSFSGNTIPSTNGATSLLLVLTADYEGTGITEVDFSTATMTSTDTSIPVDITTNSEFWDAGLLDATPVEYSLSLAYPNPFNPTTTIEYNVEVAGNVSIVVYDLIGREIKTLVNEFKSPSNGIYSVMWDGSNNQGNIVASGMYIYRMISNDFTKVYRLTFVK